VIGNNSVYFFSKLSDCVGQMIESQRVTLVCLYYHFVSSGSNVPLSIVGNLACVVDEWLERSRSDSRFFPPTISDVSFELSGGRL
jgi:hypothetical protein